VTSEAGADPVETSREALARALFDEGMALSATGRFGEACSKFEASLAADRGVGTQFRLADCYEQLGRTASAWVHFSEVVERCVRSGDSTREAFARARLESVRTRLTYWLFRVAPTPGVVLTADALELQAAVFDSRLPVDPGEHVVTARAPGHREWRSVVNVPADAAVHVVEVPLLEPDPVETSSVAPQRTQTADAHTSNAGSSVGGSSVAGSSVVGPGQAPVQGSLDSPGAARAPVWGTVGWTAVTVGGAGVLSGAVLLSVAVARRVESREDCDGNRCSTKDGVRASEDAVRFRNAAFVGLGIGAVGGITAALSFRPTNSKDASFQVRWGIGAVHLEGRF
jgi:hypothetical protein